MISLLALAIALLTLLMPSSTAESAGPEAEVALEAAGAGSRESSAMWAVSEETIGPLLGVWRATVTFPDGSSEETDLEFHRAPERGASPAVITFGPADERFSGPLSAHHDGAGLIFASQARSHDPSLGTATISGEMRGSELRGTAFLADEAGLVSWTAARITS